MLKTIKIIVMALLCLFFKVSAQHHNTNIKPLKIGDTIPEAIWNMPLQVVNHPEGKKTITLNDYKGKLIILDFWATWCGGCISAMRKNNALESQFKDKLVIIPVTFEPSEKASSFLKDNNAIKEFKLFSVVKDSILSQTFPHRFIPHYVWIKDRNAIAITSAREINSTLISSILKDTRAGIHNKEDIMDYDPKTPLYNNLNKQVAGHIEFSAIVTRYIEGLGIISGKDMDSAGRITRLYFLNMPLMHLYRYAFHDQLNVPENQIFFEVDKPKRFDKTPADYYADTHCYELIARSGASIEGVKTYMQQDLIRTFNAKVFTENRVIKVWLIKQNDRIDRLKTKGGEPEIEIGKYNEDKYLKNQPLSTLIEMLNTISPIPVIDETNYSGNIDIKLPRQLYKTDMELIKRYLKDYGLEMQLSEIKMNVAVVKNTDHE